MWEQIPRGESMKYKTIKEYLDSNNKKVVSKGVLTVEKEISTANNRVQVMYNRLLSDASLKDELTDDIKNGIAYIEFLESCLKQLKNHEYELHNEIEEYSIYDMKKTLGIE